MRGPPWASIDLILIDPPYLVNYCDRSGPNDGNDDAWPKPALRLRLRNRTDTPGPPS